MYRGYKYIEVHSEDGITGLGVCPSYLGMGVEEMLSYLDRKYLVRGNRMHVTAIHNAPFFVLNLIPSGYDPVYLYGQCEEEEPYKHALYLSVLSTPALAFGLIYFWIYLLIFLPVRGLKKKFLKKRPRRYLKAKRLITRPRTY